MLYGFRVRASQKVKVSIDAIYIVNALVSNPWMDARRKDYKILHQAPLPMCLTIFCVCNVLFIRLDFPGHLHSISIPHTIKEGGEGNGNMCTYPKRVLSICNKVPPRNKELEQKIVGKQKT